MSLFKRKSRAQRKVSRETPEKQSEYDSRASLYKMNTLEEINSIPVPTTKFKYKCDFTESIEYVLQRKATQFKKDGNLELAIACLKKSNQIMPFAPMLYTEKDYSRLESYLKLAGRFDEASAETQKSELVLSNQDKDIQLKYISNALEICGNNKNMLINITRGWLICGNCAKYHDRLYSVNGVNKDYPDFSLFENYNATRKCSCHLSVYPFIDDVSTMDGKGENSPIEYSNRPFEDDRTQQEISQYEEYIKKKEIDKKDRKDYGWLCENLPDMAPKSFGGYRNMKNRNSSNYQKLVAAAKERNYII